MTPAYYGEFMRLILLAGGAFWIFAGLLIRLLRGVIEDGDTFVFWLVLDKPYISSAEGRLEHATFVSKTLLLFGVPTLTVAALLPNLILREWGSLGILFIVLGSLFLKLVFMADAHDREARYSREGMEEGKAERIRELEEEGKLRN